ncbi:unnamed protein product, partial [Musa acuminata subsp. malaccensis]
YCKILRTITFIPQGCLILCCPNKYPSSIENKHLPIISWTVNHFS